MSAWIVSPNHISHLVAGAIRLGVIEQADATKVGRMLTNANKRSIRARYGEHDEWAARVKTYNYWTPREQISDASLCKQVHCYDYQTCEFASYEQSDAYRFVTKMLLTPELSKVDRNSDEYDRAPWGI
jgi:hypothetical protein